jgi:serine/threonine protein kinase
LEDVCNLFFNPFHIYPDLVKKELEHGVSGYVYVVEDPVDHVEAVLKLIPLGPRNGDRRMENQKTIEKEIKVGLLVARECPHLVSYWETFEWRDFFCIKMEYCQMGDLENRVKKDYIFSEEVQFFFLFFFFYKVFV